MKCKVFLIGLISFALAGLASAAVSVTDGLVMHLDADAIGLADGASVSNWNDSSTSNNDAVQSTAASQPVYVASSDSYNGHACVQFDGVDDWMDMNETVSVGSFTVFVVGKFDRPDGANMYFFSAQAGGGNDRLRIASYNGQIMTRIGNTSDYALINNRSTDTHMYTVTSTSDAWVDGAFIDGPNNTETAIPDNNGFVMGCYGGTAMKDYLEGSIAEIILYDRVLAEAEVTEVGYYLAAKYSSIDTTYSVGAHNRVPGNEGINFVPGDSLTWDAGLDPADQSVVNPAVLKHYVYLSNGSPVDGLDDPNVYLVKTIDVTNYTDPSADGIYTPTLSNDMNYWWMVEEGIDDGTGNAYPAGNINNIASATYKFTTIASFPVISAMDSKLVAPGGTVELEISIASASAITGVEWYKVGSATSVSDADADITITTTNTSSVLAIANAELADEGQYYLIATNSAGPSDSATEIVELKLEKRLAWYQFEQNADDSEGQNDGTIINGVDFASGIITTDGQLYAADPNNANYVQLSIDAFPNADFGNGMDHYTYSAWVKMDEGQGGFIFGSFNEGSSTGVQVGLNIEGHSVFSFIRQEGGATALAAGDGYNVTDGQWHYIAATYDGSLAQVFLDGLPVGEASVELTNFAAWQNPVVLLARNNRGNVDNHYDGQIDDLQIFNYAKTQEDIAQEYFNVSGNQVCLYGNPTYDLTGPDGTPDCSVDVLDFAAFAADWMSSGLYPLN